MAQTDKPTTMLEKSRLKLAALKKEQEDLRTVIEEQRKEENKKRRADEAQAKLLVAKAALHIVEEQKDLQAATEAFSRAFQSAKPRNRQQLEVLAKAEFWVDLGDELNAEMRRIAAQEKAKRAQMNESNEVDSVFALEEGKDEGN